MNLKPDAIREFALETRAAGMPLYRELVADARPAEMSLNVLQDTLVSTNKPYEAKGRAWMI